MTKLNRLFCQRSRQSWFASTLPYETKNILARLRSTSNLQNPTPGKCLRRFRGSSWCSIHRSSGDDYSSQLQQPLKVPIPTFDGTYFSWPEFTAIIQDLIEYSTDSDAIKLYCMNNQESRATCAPATTWRRCQEYLLHCLLHEAAGLEESLRDLKQEPTDVSEYLAEYLITATLDEGTRKVWKAANYRSALKPSNSIDAWLPNPG